MHIYARCTRKQEAAELYVRHHHLFRQWLDLTESLAQCAVAKLEAEYGHVDGAESLRKNMASAREKVHVSQPVLIDSEGNVFEVTGERAIVPGLKPERLARSLKDADAGRTRSLKEIIASRSPWTMKLN